METHDQKTTAHSGHAGQVHICHKCGWPFPKPHPSARHRRAHKKVCGTLDGYCLDNNSQLDVSDDGEHVSDDENKTPCSKVVERTISRKSSSGVGSQSARSEDELFADAVTDFVDSPGFGDGSYGVISQGSSLLNVAEFIVENPQSKEKNEDGDKDLQTVNAKALEGEFNEMEAMLTHDHISRTSNNLDDSGMVEHKVHALLKETGDQRIPSSKHSSGDYALGDVSEVSLGAATVGVNVEVIGNETTEIKDAVECSHDGDDARNFQDPVHSVQVVGLACENSVKVPDVLEECNLRTETNKKFNVVASPDVLCLPENPDIAVENLDHKVGKVNIPMDSDATLTVESLGFGKSNADVEIYTSTAAEGDYLHSAGDAPKTVRSVEDVVDPELGPIKSMVEQRTVGHEVQISDLKASDSDIITFSSEDVGGNIKNDIEKDQEVSSCREQIPIVSPENFSSKDEAAYGGDNKKMTAKEDVNYKCDDFNHEDKLFMENDHFCNVPAAELARTSPMSAESFELSIDHDRNEVGYDEKVKTDNSASNGSQVRFGEVAEPIEVRTDPDCGLSSYSDKNDEFFELENEYDKGDLSNNLVSDNVMVDHSQPESLPSSLGVEKLQALGDNTEKAQSKTGENACTVEKADEHIDSILKRSEDDGSSCHSSDVATDRGVKRAADSLPSVNEDDKITKKDTSVLVPNTSESSSQSDSMEGNWGSVSVLSAISDASRATYMSPSKTLQVLSDEASVSSEPKVGEEGSQLCDNKTPVESQSPPPVAVEESAGATEIQAQQNVQEQSSLGGSQVVSHVANDQLGRKKEKEIIAKVNDWDSSGKQHSDLKTLLGEAIARSRAESPNHDDKSASVPKTNEVPRTNAGISSLTESIAPISKDSKPETAEEEIGKEWNSPARYPVNIKTEKKRTKNKSYWVPFLCCSSVNAR